MADTHNNSLNQYGMADGTMTSLGQAATVGFTGVPGGAHTGYLTQMGFTSPDFASPAMSSNN